MKNTSERRIRSPRRVTRSIEIDADVARVFDQWNRLEDLPRLIDGVRRVKRIDERRSLWDADISGRQVVWEAEVVECVPQKRIRWQSCWGAPNAGEVAFEALSGGRTRLTVDLRYHPPGPIERLGARWGLLGLRIRRDLDQFRRFVERLPPEGDR